MNAQQCIGSMSAVVVWAQCCVLYARTLVHPAASQGSPWIYISITRASVPLARAHCVQAYGCYASSTDGDDPVSKSVACSYDPEFKGFCTEPEEVASVQAWTMSPYVAPLRTLGSCRTGASSPVRSCVPCKLFGLNHVLQA